MEPGVNSVRSIDFAPPFNDHIKSWDSWEESVAPDTLSSVDTVYNDILLKIVRGDLKAGTVLTSTRLAKSLNVSRTPVVSALDRLIADGILQKQKNKRAIVRADSDQWLVQVHRLREIVEPPAAALAATRISDETLESLSCLCRDAKPNGTDGWTSAARKFDFAVHLAVADYCGNLPLREAIYKCWSYRRVAYTAGEYSPHSLEVGYRGHVSLLQALSRRDPETASAAMLFHLRSVSWLSSDPGIV